ncbi:hypothetical protein SNOG_03905 [Parastagonospora nodorum SN15]|uniref:Uncharacterized protein n=1 Tax=Phaeosphaeria nodorum (strain SN15 / ATCC MYA-4574 / FGSC 10173) TaxID=321614 RepID=Q0UWF9_PHANO|nr:hypothetical protein SNOG_03905 [Parastagonospora nodorum SN15]EAT89110.1 hypothetical protein SNOG_03905 [Parastagonospora nodorum SN15]
MAEKCGRRRAVVATWEGLAGNADLRPRNTTPGGRTDVQEQCGCDTGSAQDETMLLASPEADKAAPRATPILAAKSMLKEPWSRIRPLVQKGSCNCARTMRNAEDSSRFVQKG